MSGNQLLFHASRYVFQFHNFFRIDTLPPVNSPPTVICFCFVFFSHVQT